MLLTTGRIWWRHGSLSNQHDCFPHCSKSKPCARINVAAVTKGKHKCRQMSVVEGILPISAEHSGDSRQQQLSVRMLRCVRSLVIHSPLSAPPPCLKPSLFALATLSTYVHTSTRCPVRQKDLYAATTTAEPSMYPLRSRFRSVPLCFPMRRSSSDGNQLPPRPLASRKSASPRRTMFFLLGAIVQ